MKIRGKNNLNNIALEQSIENNLLVLRDDETGIDYYMDIIDSFVYDGNTYTVMSSYEGDLSNTQKDEIVLMRFEIDPDSPLGYSYNSISDPKELNMLFDHFFTLYEGLS